MTTSDYRPIACGAYDQIEVLAMHRTRVELLIADHAGEHRVSGQVVDTSIHDGCEFLVLIEGDQRHEIRLDHIASIYDEAGKPLWRAET